MELVGFPYNPGASSGIVFDVENVGGTLGVDATGGNIDFSADAGSVTAEGSAGARIGREDGTAFVAAGTGGPGVTIRGGNAGVTIDAGAASPGPGPIEVAAVTDSLGFYGATPVGQPAAPTTLANVIAALKALGLVHS